MVRIAMMQADPSMRAETRELLPMIDLDMASFYPWRIQPVRHRLCEHPLLQLTALVELGRRLEATGSVRTHSSSTNAGVPSRSTGFTALPLTRS